MRMLIWVFVMVVVVVKPRREMLEGQMRQAIPFQIAHWPVEIPRKVRVHITRDVVFSPL